MQLLPGGVRRSHVFSALAPFVSLGSFLALVSLVSLVTLSSPARSVTPDWVVIGDPGNAPDPATGSLYGSVPTTFRISRYEVTNADYAEFLNAVAATDTHNLYNTNMAFGYGGILRSGSPGSYTYSAITARRNMPVGYVTFWDAVRYANWMHNRQPTGAQDWSTTEDGAYTLNAAAIASNTVTRNPGAGVFLPSEDEWYKAAYYDGVSSYFTYPTGANTQTLCTAPGGAVNTANCFSAVGDVVAVGGYTASAAPSGTFDQGGNVTEWNEAITAATERGQRGGSFNGSDLNLASAQRGSGSTISATPRVGFRIASRLNFQPVPLLGPGAAAALSAAMLALGVLVSRRR